MTSVKNHLIYEKICDKFEQLVQLRKRFIFEKNNNFYKFKQKHQISVCLYQDTVDVTNVTVPVDTAVLDVKMPVDAKVTAMIDNGSSMNCINGQMALKFKKYLLRERSEFRVRTGNGYALCQQYLPIEIRNGSKTIKTKFYVMWQLPHAFLIGRPLIRALGYKMLQTANSVYRHAAVDDVLSDEKLDTDFYERICYPLEPLEVNWNDISVGAEAIRPQMIKILRDRETVIARHEADAGCIEEFEYKIEIDDKFKDDPPIVCAEYPLKRAAVREVERQLRVMKETGMISDSLSEWRFPILIRMKKTGDVRICYDYRKLNDRTKKMQYPVPDTRRLLQRFKGKSLFTTIDFKCGYWHLPLRKSDRDKTAFVFNGKLYQWNVMPWGLSNCPAYFQYVMYKLFGHLDFVLIYLDDITIMSDTEEEHLDHVRQVFDIIRERNMKVRIDKCSFAQSEIQYLGFRTNKYGIRVTGKYKDKILKVEKPTTKKELQRFLGLVNYVHRFVPNIQNKTVHLTKLLHKNVPFLWNTNHDKEFLELKKAVENAQILQHPNFEKEFFVVCDASQNGIGAMLAQYNDEGFLQPVEFCSKLFNETQRRWHVSEQELYAVVYFVEKWRYLLMDKKFTIFTDHKNLQELFEKSMNFKAGKLHRWAIRLQDFFFEARYYPPDLNVIADYLSRDGAAKNMDIKNIKKRIPESLRNKSATAKELVDEPLRHAVQYLCHEALPLSEMMVLDDDVVPNTEIDRTDIVARYTQHMARVNLSPLRVREVFANDQIVGEMPEPGGSTALDVDSGSESDSANESADSDVFEPPLKQKLPLRRKSARIKKQRGIRDFAYKGKLSATLNESHVKPSLYGRMMAQRGTQKIRKFNEQTLQRGSDEIIANPRILQKPKFEVKDFYDISDMSNEFFEEKQAHDTFCFAVRTYLDTANKSLLEEFPPYLMRYVLSGRYRVKLMKTADGKSSVRLLVYYHENAMRIVVPSVLINSILLYGHGILHHGVSKTRGRIYEKFWWPNVAKDVQNHCISCPSCQASKKSRKKEFDHGKLKLFSCDRPFQIVSIDIVGPLPQTDDGMRYLVTMIDKFSRYCLIQPVRSIKTMDVIGSIQKWITLFGSPESLLSDNGAQFVAHIYKHFAEHSDFKLKYATAYHPQCNGQVERLHRWIKERLVLLSYDLGLNFVDGDDWSKFMDIIQMTYNTTSNYMTGYSPHEIVLGNKPKTPLVKNLDTDALPKTTPAAYVKYIVARQELIRRRARMQQKHYDGLRKKIHDKTHAKGICFEVGEKVYYNLGAKLIGNESKLTPNYAGPFEIVGISNDGKNLVISEVGNVANVIRCHRSQVKRHIDTANLLTKTKAKAPIEIAKHALFQIQGALNSKSKALKSRWRSKNGQSEEKSVSRIMNECELRLRMRRCSEELGKNESRLRQVLQLSAAKPKKGMCDDQLLFE